MPIYEYSCDTCGHQFEEMVFPNLAGNKKELTPECPACGDKAVTRIMSAGNFRPNGIPTGSGGFNPPKCHS